MSGELILIVEDDAMLAQGLQDWLQFVGYRVQLASNGREALERLENVHPDIILADIIMPQMDGYQLFEAVRSRPELNAIPFLFLTGRAQKRDILIGKGLGADDYITKPWGPEELLTAIRVKLKRTKDIAFTQLQRAYKDSLTVLANAIEARDAYTRGHVERVSSYSVMIAREMEMDDDEVDEIELGAILHDIGKIHVHESILSKPGDLTPEEISEMRKHTEIGAFMVKDIPYLVPATPIIKYHHERYDGMGYPEGLSGEDIPLHARIMAIADLFDALTTLRSYHEALSPEEAVAYIQNEAGKHFDPKIVEVFVRAWQKHKDD
ncbi:MAG: response regulator [Chloroflexi bacterium]|nr:response regulator [Chloroflexota bacterium]MBI5081156.1 response regulator [Chloroflexota bacterium]